MSPSEIETLRHPSGHRLAFHLRPAQGSPCKVLFLHGFGSTMQGEKADAFDRVLNDRGVSFARFDFRGHGGSDGELADLTLSSLVEDVDLVMNRLDSLQGTTVLVGSSLGALAAAWYCVRHPGAVQGQLLLAPAFEMKERTHDSLPLEDRLKWQQSGRRFFRGPWFDYELSYAFVTDLTRFAGDELAAGTKVPTWIVHGTQDTTVPLAVSERFAASASSAVSLLTVPGGDHRLTGLREQLAGLLSSFIDRLSPAA